MRRKKRTRRAAVTDSRWTSLIPPAPGDLRIVQAFVNTLDEEKGTDTLTTPEALSHWFQTWRILTPDTELNAADLTRARAVRGGLRALLFVNAGLTTNVEAATHLDRAAATVLLRVRFVAGNGEIRLEPAASGLDEALGHLFTLVRQAQLASHWARLKVCARAPCRRAFYDASRNRSGKWCITGRCGNRLSVRAYRRRHPSTRFGGLR